MNSTNLGEFIIKSIIIRNRNRDSELIRLKNIENQAKFIKKNTLFQFCTYENCYDIITLYCYKCEKKFCKNHMIENKENLLYCICLLCSMEPDTKKLNNEQVCSHVDCTTNTICNTNNTIFMNCVICNKSFCENHALIDKNGYICCEQCTNDN